MERISAPVLRNNCEALQTLESRKELEWKGQSSWPLPSNGVPAPPGFICLVYIPVWAALPFSLFRHLALLFLFTQTHLTQNVSVLPMGKQKETSCSSFLFTVCIPYLVSICIQF